MTDELVYRTGLHFNAIYVLESLGPGELKTGEDLYDTVVYPQKSVLEGLYTEFKRIADEAELRAKLSEIAESARIANHHPILHLEAHGTENGIVLADGTLVSWRSITPVLAAINEGCKMNLIVVAISCEGWNLTYSLMPSERAPVFMLVGPPDSMSAEALLQGTRRFYPALVEAVAEGSDINKALEAMNHQLPFNEWRLKPATAEILFCRVFRMYLDHLRTEGPDTQDRENALVAELAERGNLDVVQTEQLRGRLRPYRMDVKQLYDHFRKTFLMLDLFPASASRFGLTYEKCLPSPSSGS